MSCKLMLWCVLGIMHIALCRSAFCQDADQYGDEPERIRRISYLEPEYECSGRPCSCMYDNGRCDGVCGTCSSSYGTSCNCFHDGHYSGNCTACDVDSYIDCCASTCQPSSCNWYLGLGGGLQTRETAFDLRFPTTFFDFGDGFGMSATLGHRFSHCRVEAEIGYLSNGVDVAGVTTPTPATGTSTGSVSQQAFMINLYHDVDHLTCCCWTPYIGGGVGIYQSEISSVNPDFFTVGSTPLNARSDYPIAYQFRFGFTRPVGSRSDLQLGYRHFVGEEAEFAAAPLGIFRTDNVKIHMAELMWQVRF